MYTYYNLAPDIAVIHMKDGSVLFKSDTLSIKLEGASTQFLVKEIFPLLEEKKDVETIARQFKNITAEDLQFNLDKLVEAGILQRSHQPLTTGTSNRAAQFFTNFLDTVGLSSSPALEALSQFKIGVIGLEAHGTQTIMALCQSGFTNFTLIDPFPCTEDYLFTFPFLKAGENATSRQQCLQAYLQKTNPAVSIKTGPDTLTKENIEEYLTDCNLLLVAFDKGFSSVFYWVNQVSVRKNIPALYASVKGHICFAGPFVVPDKTPCYMCYKMRQVATQDDFEEAMTYEEYLDKLKTPSFSSRSALPSSLHFMAATLSSEVLKYIFSFGYLSLPGKVLEFNTLTFENATHNILQKPDCPVCQKKNFERRHLTAEALIAAAQKESKLQELFPLLISSHAGIIKKLEVVPKDSTEPALPLVYGADLANHSFLPKDERYKLNCSGKGMTREKAQISAAGEAVERYSGTVHFPDEIIYDSFLNLGKSALDPQRLVLYNEEQYAQISFAPFRAEATIGWVKGYSLVQEQPVYLPAHAVLLNYHPRYPHEMICQATSNGLAAGASLLHAVLSAALEVIERDAFLLAWHHQLACDRIDPLTHPSEEVTSLCRAYERRGVEMQLYQLPTPAPCFVFMAIAVQKKGAGPSIVVGLGADFSAQKAASQALLEVGQVRPSFKQRLRQQNTKERLATLVKDYRTVEELEDHDLLYAVPDHIAAFDFLFHLPVTAFDWQKEIYPSSMCQQLKGLTEFLHSINSDLLYYHLTPPDMEKLGLYTARVILPDFQPIHFGWKNIRLASRRFYELPVQMGWQKEKKGPAQLHQYPHPLA